MYRQSACGTPSPHASESVTALSVEAVPVQTPTATLAPEVPPIPEVPARQRTRPMSPTVDRRSAATEDLLERVPEQGQVPLQDGSDPAVPPDQVMRHCYRSQRRRFGPIPNDFAERRCWHCFPRRQVVQVLKVHPATLCVIGAWPHR